MNTIIFDGAMGTMLYEAGIISECNELLNINDANNISNIHKAYALHGAQYVKTNTFGASPLKLMKSGNDSLAFDINQAGVKLARLSGVKVAGDIGPSGELYFPYGTMTTLDIYNSFLVQAMGLKDADLILIETMSSIVEANLAYLAVRNFNKEIPIIISFTYDNGYTMMGCTPETVAKAMSSLNIFAIGTNCSGGPVELIDVVKEYRANTSNNIAVMPNAGLPVLINDKVEYPFKIEDFREAMTALVNAGANIIGGCCGTTPQHIEAIKDIPFSHELANKIIQDKYVSTESVSRLVSDCVECGNDIQSIIDIEDNGKIARINVTAIDNLEEYFNELNMLSPIPKCFTGTKVQETIIRILYHGITDIKVVD